jgi:MFS family permease
LLATFVTGYLLTKFGRKTILLYGSFFEGLACLIISIGFFILDDQEQLGQGFVLSGLFLFMAVFGLSLGPVVWLYIPEIVEPKIVPFSTAANWISAASVIIMFPIISDNVLNGNPAILFIFFTAWCFGSFLFNLKYIIETKDKEEKVIR